MVLVLPKLNKLVFLDVVLHVGLCHKVEAVLVLICLGPSCCVCMIGESRDSINVVQGCFYNTCNNANLQPVMTKFIQDKIFQFYGFSV